MKVKYLAGFIRTETITQQGAVDVWETAATAAENENCTLVVFKLPGTITLPPTNINKLFDVIHDIEKLLQDSEPKHNCNTLFKIVYRSPSNTKLYIEQGPFYTSHFNTTAIPEAACLFTEENARICIQTICLNQTLYKESDFKIVPANEL